MMEEVMRSIISIKYYLMFYLESKSNIILTTQSKAK